MKVFLTGGTGFIGSHTLVELVGRGHEVTVLARNPDKITAFRQIAGVSIVAGDLESFGALEGAMARHAACIHNALIWDEAPTELELKDTRAAARVFDAAAKAGVEQVIYTSSAAVHRPFKPWMSEGDRTSPDDFYGATKAAGEAFLSAFSYRTAMRCNVVRPVATVGRPIAPGAHHFGIRRFPEIVGAAVRGEEIRVVRGEGRQFVGVADLATLYGALLESGRNREVYVGVARNFTTWEEIARLAVEVAGGRGSVVVEDGDAEAPMFDTGKLERDFGFVFDAQSAAEEHVRYLVERASVPLRFSG